MRIIDKYILHMSMFDRWIFLPTSLYNDKEKDKEHDSIWIELVIVSNKEKVYLRKSAPR